MKDLAAASWEDLTVWQPDITKTIVESVPVTSLPEPLKIWREQGFLILDGAVAHDKLDAYAEARARLTKDRSAKDNFYGGWAHPAPYMTCPELRDVACDAILMDALKGLVGDAMGLHLALTGWVSTERNWHQDSYLNPAFLWSHYCAAWIALEDVHEDAGPFEMVPGSHLWRTLRQDLLFEHLTPAQRADPAWPTLTQDHVARVCQEEIDRRDAQVEQFLPKKGDILVWHSNLVHRGSEPRNPELLRKALICHYSSMEKRLDMKRLVRHENSGQLYFDIPG